MISAKQRALPFGFIADVLFQIIISGDASTLLTLCLLNRATYETVKSLEPHICRWFMRLHGIDAFDPIIPLDSRTGKHSALTVHSLVKSLYRHGLARRLSVHIVPAVWGPFYEDEKVEMNYEAELKLARRLEQGLHVLFHMADISRETKREREHCSQRTSLSSKQLSKISKLLGEYSDFPLLKNSSSSSSASKANTKNTKAHLTKILQRGATEYEIGKRRLAFRSTHLDKPTEIAFHCTLRMLRELLERLLLRHGPKFWHRDTRNEYSIVSWFLLNRGPRDLEELLLSTPQHECCRFETCPNSTETTECLFSNSLNEYWAAWNDAPLPSPVGFAGSNPLSHITSSPIPLTNPLTGQSLTPSSSLSPLPPSSSNISNASSLPLAQSPTPAYPIPRLIRSWAVKPTLFDHRGKAYNRAAERYLKEMWGQRHVGLHQAFAMGVFTAVL